MFAAPVAIAVLADSGMGYINANRWFPTCLYTSTQTAKLSSDDALEP